MKAVAGKCRALLKQARADLASEQEGSGKISTKGEGGKSSAKARERTPATKVKVIGISSAYRSPEYDCALWHSYFRRKYYPLMYAQLRQVSCWEGSDYGFQAVRLMVDFVRKRKAAPGFSNHSQGIAVDFFTLEDGVLLQANTGANLAAVNKRWEKSWLYHWLEEHKMEYGIERIPSEAWH